MAVYRNISLSFWTDSKVEDTFTPEDKYMYLYLLTNPYTNICGCYEISIRQISRQTGYNEESVERILYRLEHTHKVIVYHKETKELLIINWGRYNWTRSEKLAKPIMATIAKVKHPLFRDYVTMRYENIDTINTVSIPYLYGSDTTVTVSVTDTVTDTVLNTTKKGGMGGNKTAIEKRFNDLWALYPRKQGRADALKAYERAVKAGVTDETIKQGIENYVKHIAETKTEPKYVKQGSTFFSKQAWADDYKVSTAQPIEYKEELPY